MDLQFGNFRLNRSDRLLLGPNGPVELSARSFDILALLLARPDQVVGKTELFEAVWPGLVVEDNTLQVHISTLRKVLDDSMIKTVHGRGYKYAGPKPLPTKDSSPQFSAATIAVLPFTNLSSDADDEYFANGLTEDIITGLSRFRSLCVISQKSSFAYKGRSTDIRDIARELAAQYLLEGSVRRASEQLRVTAQLVDVTTGQRLWAERFDRPLGDIFLVQDDIVQRIVASLPPHIEDAERLRNLHRPTESLSAYEHWLRGKYILGNATSKQQVLQARRHFETAIELDPGYALAYVDLADSFYVEFQSPWTSSREAAGAKIFELSRRAVELDPRDSRTHLQLAWSYLHVKGDLELARIQIDLAINLNPNDYNNYCVGGWLSACTGDLAHAVACSQEAFRRSPIIADSCLETRLAAEYLAGSYPEAIVAFGQMVRPYLTAYGWAAATYAQLGRMDEAHSSLELFLKDASVLPWAPNASDAEGWRRFWADEFQTKDSVAFDRLSDGLRKAGLMMRS